ncbi:MAG: hypothetical protein QOJ80_6223 [Mycobacterium sp.]|jgi:hypothetical protein|nr:hypothetical protein [Mycobacterium sp.]
MVRELAPRARRVTSVCTGAFVLAALGLLDGRRATTHWAHCQALASIYPRVEVDPDSLFVQDGPFMTGAGISAGTDMALALVESDYGPAVARRVARWTVVFLQRPGGQAQFSVWAQSALPVTRSLREILDSIVSDPGADHSNGAIAARAAVSERHLVRMFGDQVGMTPARFVEQARLEAAKCFWRLGTAVRRPSRIKPVLTARTPCGGPSNAISAFPLRRTELDSVPPASIGERMMSAHLRRRVGAPSIVDRIHASLQGRLLKRPCRIGGGSL